MSGDRMFGKTPLKALLQACLHLERKRQPRDDAKCGKDQFDRRGV